MKKDARRNPDGTTTLPPYMLAEAIERISLDPTGGATVNGALLHEMAAAVRDTAASHAGKKQRDK